LFGRVESLSIFLGTKLCLIWMTCFGFYLAFWLFEWVSLLPFLLYIFMWWCWQCTHQGGNCEHKVNLSFVVRIDDEWLSTDSISGWVVDWPGHETKCCATMSVGLWCAGVEHRCGGRRRRWRSCGFVPIEWEWWRTSAGTWPRGQSHRVTSLGGWHLGHALTRGCGGAGCVGSAVEDCWDTCPGRGGRTCGALLGWSLKNHPTLRTSSCRSSLASELGGGDSGGNRRRHVVSSRRVRQGEATLCGARDR
jgi:hypothetical protein